MMVKNTEIKLVGKPILKQVGNKNFNHNGIVNNQYYKKDKRI